MRALENRSIFAACQYDREKFLQVHRERLRSIKNVTETRREPVELVNASARCASPSKKLMTKQANHDRIVKDNLLLAQKIFNIMEGNGDITEKINDSRHIDNHPGTMNFKQRLAEAKRVHERNMLLASRLDTVQPYYKVADLSVIRPVKKKRPVSTNAAKRSKFARELGLVLKGDRNVDHFGEMTHRSAGQAESFGHHPDRLPNIDAEMHSQSARKADYVDKEAQDRAENQRSRPNNVLLEYTKIQDGRVLDVAVLKEPFRDRYAIFGIDVDDGQRYELRLTSDEVSSILDGDILVTSVENVEVWMALLNKVSLQKVGFFARLPFSAEEVDNASNNNTSGSRSGSPTTRAQTGARGFEADLSSRYALDFNQSNPPTAGATGEERAVAGRVPNAPATSRPSKERRPGSRTTSRGGSAAIATGTGDVPARPLKSAGSGTSARPITSRPAAKAPSGHSSAVPDDPILSLFAEAGLDGGYARTEIATPGFLANATSADVTLVEVNDDFPDAPGDINVYKGVGIPVQEESAVSKEATPRIKSAKKSTPSKTRGSLKSGGSTRTNALRAAAVRRRSIESQQAANDKKASVGTTAAPTTNPANPPTQPIAPVAVVPALRPSVHKHAATSSSVSKECASKLVAKPPAGTKPPQQLAGARPKSGAVLSPKAPTPSSSAGARPSSRPGMRPSSQGVASAKVATDGTKNVTRGDVEVPVVTSALQQRVIEQTKDLVHAYVSNALSAAVASIVLNLESVSAQGSAVLGEPSEALDPASEFVEEAEDSVSKCELSSSVLREGSRATKSLNASEVGYSTDFENV